MRKNCFVESAILYPKTVKFENLKKIAKAQFSLALPHIFKTVNSIQTIIYDGGVEVDDDAFNTKQSLSVVEQWKCKHYIPNAHSYQ